MRQFGGRRRKLRSAGSENGATSAESADEAGSPEPGTESAEATGAPERPGGEIVLAVEQWPECHVLRQRLMASVVGSRAASLMEYDERPDSND